VVQLSFALGRDVSTPGSQLRLADAVLKHETLKPGVLSIEPNLRGPVQVLASVDVESGEILAKRPRQIFPTMPVDDVRKMFQHFGSVHRPNHGRGFRSHVRGMR
jgi:hypothetical protein